MKRLLLFFFFEIQKNEFHKHWGKYAFVPNIELYLIIRLVFSMQFTYLQIIFKARFQSIPKILVLRSYSVCFFNVIVGVIVRS